jgi:hypothetical protein
MNNNNPKLDNIYVSQIAGSVVIFSAESTE